MSAPWINQPRHLCRHFHEGPSRESTLKYPISPRPTRLPDSILPFATHHKPAFHPCILSIKRQSVQTPIIPITRPPSSFRPCSAPSSLIMSESLTAKQVAEHNTVDNGLYVIIDADVYKLDGFVDEHPGGAKILKRMGGKDASKQFWKVCSALLAPAEGGFANETANSTTTRAC